MKNKLLFPILFAGLMTAGAAFAEEGAALPRQSWPHKGVFGTYDKAALQRGYQVYKEVCSTCHSMKYLSYRNLAELGYTPDQIKSVAAEYTVTDGPNDEGEMFERPARPSDRFKSPFVNDNAARAANGGALPPDLSLVVKAREGGEDYIFALLTGFSDPPAGEAAVQGKYWNKYFPNHWISMPPPLSEGQVSYSDGTSASVEQEARDVAQFLAWASEPYQDQRKQMGVKVVLFLLAFAGVIYAAKKKIWKDVH